MRISDMCKKRRSELKLSNAAISELSGINLQTINNFFSQRSLSPSIYTVGPICKVLGVSLDAVFGIVDPAMAAEEQARVTAEYEHHRTELEAFRQESEQARLEYNSKIEAQSQQLTNQEQAIRHLSIQLADAKERIQSQVTAITIHRLIIAALVFYIAIVNFLAAA